MFLPKSVGCSITQRALHYTTLLPHRDLVSGPHTCTLRIHSALQTTCRLHDMLCPRNLDKLKPYLLKVVIFQAP